MSRLPLKILAAAMLTTVLLLPARAAEIPLTPEACEDWVSERWLRLLENLKSLDLDFFDRERNMLKHWETIYNPLWEARIKKEDPYSATRNAEGEMLYHRYEEAAEASLALAEEADRSMTERITAMRQALRDLPYCCDSADYRICMTPHREELGLLLDDLEKFLKNRKTGEYEFTTRLRAALSDKPSDHDELQDLYQERLERWAVHSRIEFLKKTRTLQEKMEVDWPGERCCKNCTPEAQGVANDPVLNRVKPDPQGNKGVAGNVVNNAGISEAFDRYEMKNKKRKEG